MNERTNEVTDCRLLKRYESRELEARQTIEDVSSAD